MRRTPLLLGAMLAALVAVGGVAWAATTIRCPSDPLHLGHGTCWGTNKDDVVIGTDGRDLIDAGFGDDIVRAGGGADHISGDDYWLGEDENHGGRGTDHIAGNLDSEKHFGGRGDDLIVDEKSGKNPDVLHCGPGRDEILYNKGLDKVADDCEVLRPASDGSITPE